MQYNKAEQKRRIVNLMHILPNNLHLGVVKEKDFACDSSPHCKISVIGTDLKKKVKESITCG
jgi:hypothetical protein